MEAEPDRLRDPRHGQPRAALRLRDQGAGRQLDAVLLGGQLRADLSRAETALRGRAGRGHRRPARRPQADRLRDHRRRRGAS